MHCSMKIKLYAKTNWSQSCWFLQLFFYSGLSQSESNSRFSVNAGSKMTSIKLGLHHPGRSSGFLCATLKRESHSGGASIKCNFTAETRDLFIFFTRSWESWRLKLGYLILALVKPWMEGGGDTVWCSFDWGLAQSRSDIFHEFMMSMCIVLSEGKSNDFQFSVGDKSAQQNLQVHLKIIIMLCNNNTFSLKNLN